MANIATQRIKREFNEVMKSDEFKNDQIYLRLVGDDFRNMEGTIKGPPDTPYETGLFKLKLSIPETYPFNPPKVTFVSKIWHPNVSSVTGAICLDILKDQWAAAMTLRTVLISLQALLGAPEPDDPQDAVVASQYKTDLSLFTQTAQMWTNEFAEGTKSISGDFENSISKLREVGISRMAAIMALSNKNWNVDSAIEDLF